MFRRQFIQLAALSGVGALTPLEAMGTGPRTTVTFQVKGFTCITCAVGLDTLLGKEKGIVSSRSTYPGGKVTVVVFDPARCSIDSIRKSIGELGFSVESFHQA